MSDVVAVSREALDDLKSAVARLGADLALLRTDVHVDLGQLRAEVAGKANTEVVADMVASLNRTMSPLSVALDALTKRVDEIAGLHTIKGELFATRRTRPHQPHPAGIGKGGYFG